MNSLLSNILNLLGNEEITKVVEDYAERNPDYYTDIQGVSISLRDPIQHFNYLRRIIIQSIKTPDKLCQH